MNYVNDKIKQANWFPYSISKNLNDFIIPNGVHTRCDPQTCVPFTECQSNNPNYWKNFTIKDIVKKKEFEILCLGCSFTYGTNIPVEDTWPTILGKSLNLSTENLGVPNGGLDASFINLKASYKKFKFKKVVLLVPFLNRKILTFKKENMYFQLPINPNTEWAFDENIAKRFFSINFMISEIQRVKKEIVLDTNCLYSLNILKEIIKFTQKNNLEIWLSAYEYQTYTILQENFSNILPFYDMSFSKRLAGDNIHPSRDHNRIWVKKIKNYLI